jgi:predicted esterase
MSLSVGRKGLLLACVIVSLAVMRPAVAQTRGGGEAQRAAEAFHSAYQAKDWSRAIEVGLKLVELAGNNSTHQYNLACAYALNGDADEAAKWLGKAGENGFSQLWLFETDADLNSVREHAGYQAALAAVGRNHQQAVAKLKQKFERQPPLVFLPPRHDPAQPTPLLLLLHGYGGWAREIAVQWRPVAARAGMMLVVPQAVRPVAGTRGYNWGSVDEADTLVQLTLESVKEEFKIDEKRLVITGFSQGAWIAHAVAVRHPQQFCGVIPIAGPYVPDLDAPPKANGAVVPRVYFMCGARDRVLDDMRRAARDFGLAGYDVEFRIYPGVAHAFPRNRDEELRKALRFVLGQ